MAGWDERPSAGYPNGDPYEMPVDLAAVQADDALLDMIGRGEGAAGDADDELTRVLAEWRREVHTEPVREIVDTTTAMAVIRAAARQPARRRNPVYGSAAAAAAVLVIAFSSVGLVAKSAQPGDQLWGVTQVLYRDYARSVETAAAVRSELNEAKVALNQGNPEKARAALQQIQQQLPVVGDDQGRAELIARHRQLEATLNGPPETTSAALPGGTGPANSTRVGPETTTSSNPNNPTTSAGSTMPTPMPSPAAGLPASKPDMNSSQYPGPAGYPGLGHYPGPGPGSGSPGQDGYPGYSGYPGYGGYGPGAAGSTRSGNSGGGRHRPGSVPSPGPLPSPPPDADPSAPGPREPTTSATGGTHPKCDLPAPSSGACPGG